MKFNTLKIFAACLALLAAGTGCKKDYLETNPTDQLAANELFKTTTSAYTALNGMHKFMNAQFASGSDSRGLHSDFGIKSYDLIDDLMGNDMVNAVSGYENFQHYYRYTMTSSGSASFYGTYGIWYFFYKVINNANNIIANIDNADGPIEEKNDIKGQALAYRAWALYRLTIYYQHTYGSFADPNGVRGVPIYLTPTEGSTEGNACATLKQDYDQIVSDLETAVSLLENGVIHVEKSHISLAAARGIYARVALTMKDYTKAREMAIRARENYPLMTPEQYKSGFNSVTNSEWIWGSTLSSEQYNDLGIVCFFSFMDPSCPGYAQAGSSRSITKALYDLIPDGDVRKEVFNSSSFLPTKFHVADPTTVVGDNVYMRSAEMYLIQAEAEAKLNMPDAKATLEELVTTRYPAYVAPVNNADLVKEIYLQRRIELWGEGFGYKDIVRLELKLQRPSGSGNHAASNAAVMNLPENSPQFLWKIPQREIDVNPNIGPGDQNP